MILDHGLGNVQGLGNSFGALTLSDPRQNLLLALRQRRLGSCFARMFLDELGQHLVAERGL